MSEPIPSDHKRLLDLAFFGSEVLRILQEDKEWSADTLEEIAGVACHIGLAATGPDGLFSATANEAPGHPYGKDDGDGATETTPNA